MRRLLAALLFTTACGGPSKPPPPIARTPPIAAPAVDAGPSAPPSEPVPGIEVLAARGPVDLPSMREVVRSEDATRPSALPAGSSDACFRAVVAASAPVRAWFEDERHEPRGAELSGLSGFVPPRGPACARRGETLRLIVEPNEHITARAVVWQAP